jgi:WD40 repeat protein
MPITAGSSTSHITSSMSTQTATSSTTLTSDESTTQLDQVTLTGHRLTIFAIVQLSNGDIASAGYDKSILIWDSVSYQLKRNLTLPDSIQNLAAFSNGYLANTCFNYKSIWIWDPSTGVIKNNLNQHSNQIFSLLPLNADTLASSASDFKIIIWNIVTGSLIRTLKLVPIT